MICGGYCLQRIFIPPAQTQLTQTAKYPDTIEIGHQTVIHFSVVSIMIVRRRRLSMRQEEVVSKLMGGGGFRAAGKAKSVLRVGIP